MNADETYFTLIIRYFWVLGILFAALNAFIQWQRVQSQIKVNPALRPGYYQMLKGYWLILTLPWVVMGLGIMIGDVPSIFHFLAPKTTNPYVLAWWGVYWLSHGFVSYWILFGNGARMLIDHPGFLRGTPQNPAIIKLLAALALAAAIAITIVLFHQPPPIVQHL